ncbi:hypothetical protein [Agrococcus beijingensis]|uniref:hypothetical protein n=1 Tax=Agrococcus beijingensis TaxID=3068634 RepID=UPI0027416A78|nr:hypothetical protein [Agrococcus sp. REN33]
MLEQLETGQHSSITAGEDHDVRHPASCRANPRGSQTGLRAVPGRVCGGDGADDVRHDGRVSWRWGSVWPVWLLAAIGAVVVGVLQPSEGIVWMPILLGMCTLVAFGIQLGGPTEPGLVDRLAAAVFGSVVVLAVASAIIVPLTAL